MFEDIRYTCVNAQPLSHKSSKTQPRNPGLAGAGASLRQKRGRATNRRRIHAIREGGRRASFSATSRGRLRMMCLHEPRREHAAPALARRTNTIDTHRRHTPGGTTQEAARTLLPLHRRGRRRLEHETTWSGESGMGTIARRADRAGSTGCAPAVEHAAALLNFEFDDSVPVLPRRTACSEHTAQTCRSEWPAGEGRTRSCTRCATASTLHVWGRAPWGRPRSPRTQLARERPEGPRRGQEVCCFPPCRTLCVQALPR